MYWIVSTTKISKFDGCFFQFKSILTWNCGCVKNFFPKKASGIDAGLNEEAHCHFMFICIHLQVNLQSTFDLCCFRGGMNGGSCEHWRIQDSTCKANKKKFVKWLNLRAPLWDLMRKIKHAVLDTWQTTEADCSNVRIRLWKLIFLRAIKMTKLQYHDAWPANRAGAP